jgi:oligosaccharide repeat unit polymerase
MLGMELYLFSKADAARKRWILAGILGVLLLYLTIVTRYDLFRFLVFTVVLYHYGKKRLSPVHLGAGLIAAVTLFLVGFLARVNLDAVGSFNEMIKVKLPHRWAWASNFYAYLANDFWNLDFAIQKYVDGDHYYPMQYGLGLFRSLLWNLRLEGQLDAAYGFDTIMNESATKLKGFNTVVYVWHLYKDFGYVGAFLIPFLAGLFAAKYYFSFLFKPTLFKISLWGIIAGVITLSYHAPLWELWFMYLNLIVLAIAHRKVRFF